MDKYSFEAKELLSESQMFEVKAGKKSSSQQISECSICESCVGCSSACTVCVTSAI